MLKNLFRFPRVSVSQAIWPCLCAVVVLAAACILISGVLDPYDGRILKGVSIGGLDVGGMTRKEATGALRLASEKTLSGQPLLINLPENCLSLSPEDTHLRLRYRKAIREAYRIGRTGTSEEKASVCARVQEEGYSVGLLPFLTYDEEFIRGELEAYAQTYDTTLSQYSCRMEGDMPQLGTTAFQDNTPCQTLLVTLGTPEAHLDVPAALEQIAAVYHQPFSREPYSVTVQVIPEAVPDAPDADTLWDTYCIDPVSDSLDMHTFRFVPGSYGYRFDKGTAKKVLEAAGWGDTVSIAMEGIRPEILGDEVYFRDVLGHCETRHNTNENRNTNLRLLCASLDGLVVKPGETFSYNEALGERTAEKGYLPAPAYSGTRLTDAVGGGVCQGSTTLYNCVLLADLEVLQRSCHGAPVTYVPFGLDAAVNWGTTDFQFRNTSHFPIKITAQVSDGYVRMQILGTDEKDYYIEMTSGYDDSNPEITYAVSYKCKYSKETGELLSKEREAFSTYYRNIG